MVDYEAKFRAEVDLHKRKALKYTVLRPGLLTEEKAGGAEVGQTQLGQTSRQLVAKAILEFANLPSSAGLTLNIMDGKGDLHDEIVKAVDARVDMFTE